MCGDTPLHKLLGLESVASQSKVESMLDVMFHSWKEVWASNISEEANASLWHSINGVIRGNSDRSMDRHSYSSAHDNSIPDADLKWLHVGERIVQNIFIMEESLFYRWVSFTSTRFVNELDVSTCAESFTTNSANKKYSWCSLRIIFPFLNLFEHQMNHFKVQGIQVLWCIKLKLGNIRCQMLIDDLWLFFFRICSCGRGEARDCLVASKPSESHIVGMERVLKDTFGQHH